jgi:glucose/arabinose dehydrogenase
LPRPTWDGMVLGMTRRLLWTFLLGLAACSSNGAKDKPSATKDAAISGDTRDAGGSPSDAGPVGKTCTGSTPLDAYVSDPKLCVYVYAQSLPGARQLAFAPNGDLFVSAGKLVVLWDDDKDGTSQANERATFGQASGLNHGVAFSRDAKFVYASSATTVYRWAYASGQRMAKSDPEVVIQGIPDGGHSTRTLAFDSKGRLIVSIGSASNVDTSQSEWDTRAQIRRYTVANGVPTGGLAYTTGEVLASGMRNEAGIFVDTDDRIWSVENGRDNLADDDLGGDIHNDNPGEEINLVDGKDPKFYGYPLCYSEFKLTGGKGQGTQWADQTLASAIQKTDDYCRDTTQVRPPIYAMPAHWAPLGIIRYTGRALPMNGDLIIGAHGSWNRDPAAGRVIARAKLDGNKVTAFEVIAGEKDASGKLKEGAWSVRPVDVRQGPDDALYVSDDNSGQVLKIGYAR